MPSDFFVVPSTAAVAPFFAAAVAGVAVVASFAEAVILLWSLPIVVAGIILVVL